MFTGKITQVAHIQISLKTGSFVPAAVCNETTKYVVQNMRSSSRSQTECNCYLVRSGANFRQTAGGALQQSYDMRVDQH